MAVSRRGSGQPMIYSNYNFLLLLPPLLVLFYTLRGTFAQNLLLLVVSAVFLAWSNVWNLLPACVVLLVVYQWFSLDARYRIGWRGAGWVIVFLVLQLGYLKYRDFIAGSFGLRLPEPAAFALFIPLG